MNLQMYVMDFSKAHFGNGLLEDSDSTFSSNRLFSALFLEALKYDKEAELLELANNHQLLISNAFIERFGIYLPKPIGYPQLDRIAEQRSDIKSNVQQMKLSKKIDSIHYYDLDAFVQGDEEDLAGLVKEQEDFYKILTGTKVNLAGDPYRVGEANYHEEIKLGVIASKHPLLEELMTSLQYSGIGGKRSSGYGQFTLSIQPLDENLASRLTINAQQPVMLLNDSLPQDEELEMALKDAKYLLKKSSGYAFSPKLSDNFRKQDLYKFQAGSTFQRTFQGKLVNVAPDKFLHPVWNYSLPLFYKLEV